MHMFLPGLLTVLVFLTPLAAQAQELVFVIRPAEKEAEPDDPALTAAGRARAGRWAAMLRSAGLDLVVTSDALRTRETGGIVAEALDLPVEEVPRTETQALLDLLEWDYDAARVLIVGHTETIPSILRGLGVSDPLDISQTDFANLFFVEPGAGAALGHLRMP